ncbi:ImmA/IrrE family metallo-endopeptidase [Acetobacter cerevisiae]|uniref:ImmA/IrrE family metallo-endopeptidase n=1 Tax=Acetobacter cerevisiae TaxID=178900 RepID=UPI0020A0F9E3|nr:ImmA/IrrE family metallo-endopeptidase [Acetobacter cerevisiae]MCP1277413.1 ImmA/IrrE family metallo-endopeptidase [Acetobacter cerevisiae]
MNPIDMHIISASENVSVIPLIDCVGDGASGMFRADGPNPVIEINPQKSNAHQRFTFAHELGHYFLGHGNAARDTQAQLMARDPKEMSANRFAAALLMPAEDVQNAVYAGMSLSQMAALFGVSEEAMGYRLQNLGL